MIRFRLILFLFFTIFTACKTKYATKEFKNSQIPASPNYDNLDSWAAHPDKNDSIIDIFYNTDKENLKADIFYIYPTLLTNKKNDAWNSDVYDFKQNNKVKNIAIKFQASAWANAGRIYSPLYRQVHYRSFYEPYTSNGGRKAGEIAYNDIRRAFIYYLKNFNNGKPIIIAGHSQGAYHCKTLLKEFFDGKELQNQLVAAYIPGTRVDIKEFKTIHALKSPHDIKGYLSWNTFRLNKQPKKGKHPAHFSWKKGQYVTNPINWDESRSATIQDHKGLLFYDGEIYPNSVFIEIYDGLLWSSVPKGIKGNYLLKLIRNYHFGDINIFWKDISENAKIRVDSFYNLLKN
ncbi:MAG: hypothetical protein CMC36_05185 [Flavobacteriaceae bacterium]|nr:hypothetical protein [Flavobacteriaceae bacterium]|tara:strand:+ start:2482 stop:3519 length:1038 start_codon:yes stop_codon:yes gene_type:complete